MRKRDLTTALVGAAIAMLLAGGVAWAAIPGGGGVIQGCYDSGGNLKVVVALPCPRGYTSLSWNQQGPAGTSGEDGASAYEVWLGLGNIGTEQDFVDSLRGPADEDGEDGNLAIAGQTCPQGTFVTGFDQSGNIVCRNVLSDAIVDEGVDCEPLNAVPVADLHNCDLRGANLSGASLSSANLRDANLSGANLSNASLNGADLEGANMNGADLSGANLRDADLRDATLNSADLSGANLTDADLILAFLSGANWNNTTCPDGTNSDDNGGTCSGHL
jgi:hypothetical protein